MVRQGRFRMGRLDHSDSYGDRHFAGRSDHMGCVFLRPLSLLRPIESDRVLYHYLHLSRVYLYAWGGEGWHDRRTDQQAVYPKWDPPPPATSTPVTSSVRPISSTPRSRSRPRCCTFSSPVPPSSLSYSSSTVSSASAGPSGYRSISLKRQSSRSGSRPRWPTAWTAFLWNGRGRTATPIPGTASTTTPSGWSRGFSKAWSIWPSWHCPWAWYPRCSWTGAGNSAWLVSSSWEDCKFRTPIACLQSAAQADLIVLQASCSRAWPRSSWATYPTAESRISPGRRCGRRYTSTRVSYAPTCPQIGPCSTEWPGWASARGRDCPRSASAGIA